ncbi:hypothetical protein QUA70_22245 [Microcoleus sp. LAD1_D5]|uniref:hypothetical protein n=1 Tax=unclassified Microcoleus TaxID=2642155 RepID=UPI002FD648AB
MQTDKTSFSRDLEISLHITEAASVNVSYTATLSCDKATLHNTPHTTELVPTSSPPQQAVTFALADRPPPHHHQRLQLLTRRRRIKPKLFGTAVSLPASPNHLKSGRSPTSPFRDTAVMPCPHPQHYLRHLGEKSPDNLPATALGDRP